LTGDGRGDVVVGERTGSAYIFDGSTGFLFHSLKSPNEHESGRFGQSVAGVPDLNEDGQGEVLIGASGENPGNRPNAAGRAYVFDGSTGALLLTYVSPNEELNGRFGGSLSWTPDANGDDRPDLVIGASGEDPSPNPGFEGRAYIFDSSSGALLQTLTSPDRNQRDHFWFPTGMPDANGDGRGDVIVGGWDEGHSGNRDDPLYRSGRAYIFDGSSGALLRVLYSPNRQRLGFFGIPTFGLPDLNGDNLGDALLGAYHEFDDAGRSYIFFTTPSSPEMSVAPKELSFGQREIDRGPTNPMSVSIRNEQAADLLFTGQGIGILGVDSDDFSITDFGWRHFTGASIPFLPALETQSVLVAFDPSTVGIKSASLTITSNDPDEPTVVISLTGSGVFFDPTPTPTGTNTLTPTPTTTSTPTSTITSTPTPLPCDSGYYLLDSFGGRHRVGNPPVITGPVYFGFDIARDLERATCLGLDGKEHDLVVLDGFGAAHFVDDSACNVMQEFYFSDYSLEDFPKGRAVDLEMSADGTGFWVLTDYGEIYRAGTALGNATTPEVGTGMKGVLGFDIPTPRTPATANLPSDGAALRAVSLMVMKNQINGADGYVILDSMGGHHHYYYYGEAIVPGSRLSEPHNDPRFLLRDPGYYVWPFFPGLDIARDLELHPTQQGAVILDGWDGIHPVPVDVPSNPVWFARNEDQLGGPAQMVGMPYIVMGWDDPSTPETENTLDAHSIFTDLEFSAGCPNGGLYTLDKFGGVFALGKSRSEETDPSPGFGGSPYFFPFLYAEDMEVFGEDETDFEGPPPTPTPCPSPQPTLNLGGLVWVKQAGGSGRSRSNALDTYADGSSIMIGEYEESITFAIGEPNETTLVAAPPGFFAAKHDSNGNLVWARDLSYLGEAARGYGVSCAANGDFFLTGGLGGSTSLGSISQGKFYLVKFDGQGELLWFKDAETTDRASGSEVAALSDGGVIVAGSFRGFITFGTDVGSPIVLGVEDSSGYDIFLCNYDSIGEIVWAVAGVGNGDEGINEIEILPSGDIAVAGNFAQDLTFGKGEVWESMVSGGFIADPVVALFNPTGTLKWLRAADGGSVFRNSAETISLSPNDLLTVGGWFGDGGGLKLSFGFFNGEEIAVTKEGPFDPDAFVVAYDMEGAPHWARSSGGNTFDHTNGIGTASNDEILVVYLMSSLNPPFFLNKGRCDVTQLPFKSGRNAVLVRYDLDGNIRGFRTASQFISTTGAKVLADGSSLFLGNHTDMAILDPGGQNEVSIDRIGRGSVALFKFAP
jgi:hypothetical protein